ncbi:IS110 family transposase [Desulfosporosinus orientis]|uniref:IS110 family transposase n=1 Tax=Desulfosporosinus orientis TaxID=1563 RepID=UPI0009D95584|nr:transposase [Desulfosporosinus orientis]
MPRLAASMIMKIVFKFFCPFPGAFFVCITTKNNGVYQTEVKTFSTMIDGIEMAISWLHQHDCHVVVIESTGKYWIPVFNLMEDSFALTLANPYFTKTFPGNKTDRRDAKWLAELHRLGLVQPVLFPQNLFANYETLLDIGISWSGHVPLKKAESIIFLRSAI